MSRNIYAKEKIRVEYKKPEKEKISPNIIQNIFKFQDLRRYNDDFKSEVYNKYNKICKEFGFEESLYKTEKDIKNEYEVYITKKSKQLFKRKNKSKKIKLPEYIRSAENNEIDLDLNPELKKLYNIYKDLTNKKDFLIFCEIFKNVKIQNNEKALIIIKNIFQYNDNWINKIENFKLITKNLNKALFDLTKFLFCKYDINPIFVELMSSVKDSIVFIEISKGESPKKVIEKHFPEYKLTKKMINDLNTKKSNLTFNKRIREIQLTGFQNKIINEVLKSYKSENFIEDEELFMMYLIHMNNQDLSMFNQNEIMPIFDYVKYLKNIFEQRNSIFKMKEHSLEKLYEGMIKWHKELGKTKHDFSWEGLLKPIYKKTKINEETKEYKEVVIKEITTSNELRKEGKEMKHCVYSYASNCKRGICAIFSLKIKEYDSTSLKGRATIEVRNNKIVQIRSKLNQPVKKSDMNYIEDWKKENEIN